MGKPYSVNWIRSRTICAQEQQARDEQERNGGQRGDLKLELGFQIVYKCQLQIIVEF